MKNLKNKNPYLASVELTNICSSVCPGCLAKEGLEKEQLHIDQWTKILKNINPEIKHINISGGEPTEYKDLIKFCNIL
jgi:organic radical activating enzyme